MNRRHFLRSSAAWGATALCGCDLSFRDGVFNACRTDLPARLAQHPLLSDAWRGIDASNVIDSHCHLFGNGDSGRGVWSNPSMQRLAAPAQLVQRLFYLNGGCVHDAPGQVDTSVVDRLVNQVAGLRPGAKLLLLGFDWARDEHGAALPERSTFHVPDAYAMEVAQAHPSAFEWAASIHPADPAALPRLDRAKAQGALAVKWLPPAQLIDPASPRLDDFYRRLATLDVPLITHAGDERAVRGHDQTLGNPLKLRRALDLGVRVIVAHCASLGSARDLDRGVDGPPVPSFALFGRLMDDPAHHGRLTGDLSAVTFGNRDADVLRTLLERTDWHPRLLNGSDYPLPGVLPLVALDTLAARGMLAAGAVPVLREIRDHNAILFDFVLKRSLRSPAPGGRGFPAERLRDAQALRAGGIAHARAEPVRPAAAAPLRAFLLDAVPRRVQRQRLKNALVIFVAFQAAAACAASTPNTLVNLARRDLHPAVPAVLGHRGPARRQVREVAAHPLHQAVRDRDHGRGAPRLLAQRPVAAASPRSLLMGVHSTLFGPVKYAILPQHLQRGRAVGGNALVEMGTSSRSCSARSPAARWWRPGERARAGRRARRSRVAIAG